mmetsp:Transcript_35821/g.43258  ORF Transcript_35821/g.43258 Transcript_35821/m.43258 type:complete len:202 (-) Transcript_35821:92-697(-)|eukprot:CAMPEP_0197848002 /NCGR_PEP_ID=MMETSP1438-20131217/7729_1 /TAXON_ID=1461541 /ORGANISM="Pterosperma sp., Strain CCMP1384" /LENGTH=201 /DNA_ID=CAMNT_0043460103 /DNA_START=258 /DNA_END=863 /DNA_ORIENTATION=+
MAAIEDIFIKEIPAKIEAAVSEGKWPLFLDAQDSKPVSTYFQYASGVRMVEAKKGLGEAVIQKIKSVEAVQEEWREQLEGAMVQRNQLGSLPGQTFWMHLANTALDFNKTFATEGSALPPDFFDCTKMQDENVKQKYIKGDMDGVWGPEFKIVFTSDFEKDDVVDFLGEQMPLGLLKIFNVVEGGGDDNVTATKRCPGHCK